MTNPESDVIGGVDTHKYAHHAAVIDGNGRLLGAKEFTSDDRGQEALLAWMRSHGAVRVIGVEGTGFTRPARLDHWPFAGAAGSSVGAIDDRSNQQDQ